jgi:hypothetical protein
VKVQFKFKARAGAKAREALIAALRRVGARDVHALFPDERDAELARLFVAEVADEAGGRALALLEQSAAVEFAEREARRRLIR